jgi:hypothetical protein
VKGPDWSAALFALVLVWPVWVLICVLVITGVVR